MNCSVGGSEIILEVPLGAVQPGEVVRVAIRAGDIMVATSKPVGLSARNTLKGRVMSLRRVGVTVIVTVQAGVSFEVHMTPGACQELMLEAGEEVWLVIKTYSCHLVTRKSDEQGLE
jgi:molybdate transport system ATP-binding protein